MIVHTLADQILIQLLMDSLYTLLSHYKFDAEKIFCLQNGWFVNLDNYPDLYKIS